MRPWFKISYPLIASTCLRNASFFPFSMFQAPHSDRLWSFKNNSSPFNLVLICTASEKHQLSSPPMNLQCTSIFSPFPCQPTVSMVTAALRGVSHQWSSFSPALRADVCAAPIAQLCTAQPNATDERRARGRKEQIEREKPSVGFHTQLLQWLMNLWV